MASIERARWIRNREKRGGDIHLVRFNGHRRRRIEWKRRGGGGQAGTEQRHDPGDEIGTKVAGMRRTWKFETDTSKWNADPKVGNPGEYSLSSSPPLVKLDYFVRGKDEGVRASFLPISRSIGHQISRFIHIRFGRQNEFVRIRLVWNCFRRLRFSSEDVRDFEEIKEGIAVQMKREVANLRTADDDSQLENNNTEQRSRFSRAVVVFVDR